MKPGAELHRDAARAAPRETRGHADRARRAPRRARPWLPTRCRVAGARADGRGPGDSPRQGAAVAHPRTGGEEKLLKNAGDARGARAAPRRRRVATRRTAQLAARPRGRVRAPAARPEVAAAVCPEVHGDRPSSGRRSVSGPRGRGARPFVRGWSTRQRARSRAPPCEARDQARRGRADAADDLPAGTSATSYARQVRHGAAGEAAGPTAAAPKTVGPAAGSRPATGGRWQRPRPVAQESAVGRELTDAEQFRATATHLRGEYTRASTTLAHAGLGVAARRRAVTVAPVGGGERRAIATALHPAPPATSASGGAAVAEPGRDEPAGAHRRRHARGVQRRAGRARSPSRTTRPARSRGRSRAARARRRRRARPSQPRRTAPRSAAAANAQSASPSRSRPIRVGSLARARRPSRPSLASASAHIHGAGASAAAGTSQTRTSVQASAAPRLRGRPSSVSSIPMCQSSMSHVSAHHAANAPARRRNGSAPRERERRPRRRAARRPTRASGARSRAARGARRSCAAGWRRGSARRRAARSARRAAARAARAPTARRR